MDQRRQSVRALMRALPSLDQLLALPRRRFDEAAAGLGRGLELNTLNNRRGFERVAAHLRPDVLANRIAERRQSLNERMARAERTIERLLDRSKSRIDRAEAILASLPGRLRTQTARVREQLIHLSRNADTAMRHQLARARAELAAQDRVLQSLSYKNVLKRGYAVIRDDENKPISQAAGLAAGTGVSIEFSDGRIGAITTEGGAPPSTGKKRATKPVDAPKQGSLF
jgi:exodeoxyribonuclease VII large subunit